MEFWTLNSHNCPSPATINITLKTYKIRILVRISTKIDFFASDTSQPSKSLTRTRWQLFELSCR